MSELHEVFIELLEQGVAEVRGQSHDPEAAHSMEDRLHRDALEHIMVYAPWPWNEVAKTALKTVGLDFERWCA